MSPSFLSIRSLERRLATDKIESLTFEPGVNVFVGRPNTGKTKWLQTLDFLLGDTGANPYEQSDEEGLAEKYDAAAATLCIADETFRIERRWREAGSRWRNVVFFDFSTSPGGVGGVGGVTPLRDPDGQVRSETITKMMNF